MTHIIDQCENSKVASSLLRPCHAYPLYYNEFKMNWSSMHDVIYAVMNNVIFTLSFMIWVGYCSYPNGYRDYMNQAKADKTTKQNTYMRQPHSSGSRSKRLLLPPWSMLHLGWWCSRYRWMIMGTIGEMWPRGHPYSIRPSLIQGIYSPSGKTSYRQIWWKLEAARLHVIMIVSLWNLTGISAALLPRSLSNVRAIGKV